jgi:thioredoxin reductase
MNVTVFGKNTTAMHYAHLYNYLGIPAITGTEFQKVAREQVSSFGAVLNDDEIERIERTAEGFRAVAADGSQTDCQYLILAEGKGLKLVDSLGLERTGAGATVDRSGRTAIAGLYVVGRGTRLRRSQAIISAGDGAAAALDILSEDRGRDFLDYDSVE